LPNTQTTARFSSCAYTQKVRKFCRMMLAEGFAITLYGPEVSDVEGADHVTTVTEDERRNWFGDGFDTVLTPFNWDTREDYWKTSNVRAIKAIRERADDHDILCPVAGSCQEPVANALPVLTCAEWAVGYHGIFAKHRAFESSAWMHYIYGQRNIVNGHFYDRVIPNCFDPADFPRCGTGSGGYVMFLGRLVSRKGPHVALQIAQQLGKTLVVAGPGATDYGTDYIISPEVYLQGDVTYVGELGIEERAKWLEGAEALICPTLYLEPFGGVAVEAMLAGTPAVTTDFGAFTETVEDGLTGYRFSTLQEGCDAVTAAVELDRKAIRERALERYSLEAVGPQFTRWFTNLDGLWGEGWNARPAIATH
jgi:glycosyltransferase involved in cell wall biosynthesis